MREVRRQRDRCESAGEVQECGQQLDLELADSALGHVRQYTSPKDQLDTVQRSVSGRQLLQPIETD